MKSKFVKQLISESFHKRNKILKSNSLTTTTTAYSSYCWAICDKTTPKTTLWK